MEMLVRKKCLSLKDWKTIFWGYQLLKNFLWNITNVYAYNFTVSLVVSQTGYREFWQIPLAEKSRLLTTFITPYGRFCFNKLPFGISSAQEIFQRRINEVLSGLPGVLCHVDDVLVFGKDQAEHEARLHATLQAAVLLWMKLNANSPEECYLSRACYWQQRNISRSKKDYSDTKHEAPIFYNWTQTIYENG